MSKKFELLTLQVLDEGYRVLINLENIPSSIIYVVATPKTQYSKVTLTIKLVDDGLTIF